VGQCKQLLDILDILFLGIFTFEMSIKILALGLVFGSDFAYLKNSWNLLDCSIVLLGWFTFIMDKTSGQGGGANIGWIKNLRVVRALRPLRTINRVPELKQVVNSLFKAAPTLGNVILLLMIFYMIFGILGVNLFKGKFNSCNAEVDVGRIDCVGSFIIECSEVDTCDGCDADTGLIIELKQWTKPGEGSWGFDHIGEALTTLFEVSTLEMWLDIMYFGVDSPGSGLQPVLDNNPLGYIYFIVFIFFGSFFLMELFVGAIVTSYQVLNEEAAGAAFQSERQQREVAQKVLKQGEKPFIPKYACQIGLYNIMHNPIVENIVMLCICLNILVMALSFDFMSAEFTSTLDGFNDVFTFIFAAESVLKLSAEFPSLYFSNGWNQYDFFVVTVTTSEFIYVALSPPDAPEIPGASILRVFRIMRIMRLLQKLKGLTNLFLTVARAMPTLINVAGLLGLIFFIYAVLGMHLFGKIPQDDEFLTARANFETFGTSMLVVFRMSTGESWNGIMNACKKGENAGFAMPYFITFQILGQYIMLNLFIAVMLDYYQRQLDSTEPFLSDDDRAQFETTWCKFVGRERRHPYKPYPLLPVQLFDDFMTELTDRTGWLPEERINRVQKDRVLKQAPFTNLPVRALKVLVPWKGGMRRNIDGVIMHQKWNEMKEAGEIGDIAHNDEDEDFDEPHMWKPLTEYKEQDLVIPVGTKAVRGEYYRFAVEPAFRCTNAGPLVLISGKEEPRWDQTNKLGHVLDKPVDPKAQEEESPLRWEKVDVDAVKYAKGMKLRPSTGYNQIREQLPRTSLMAVQYYQFDEVWHTLYNRAEMRHLKDPENTDFVDDEARNRQVGATRQHAAMHRSTESHDTTNTPFIRTDVPL
jgi:hypothetical protein